MDELAEIDETFVFALIGILLLMAIWDCAVLATKMLGVVETYEELARRAQARQPKNPGHRRDVQGIIKCSLLKELQLSWRHLQPLPSLCS
jgi:hypothetical protein